MEVSAYVIWNVLITLIIAPIFYAIRQNTTETRRQDILLNKTREEIAKDYVTKTELRDDMGLIMDRIEKIGEKLDKLFEVDAPFVAIDTSDNWRPGGEPGKGNALVGTGIFAFDIGCQSQILTEFQKNPQLAFETCKLEQVWVQKKASSIDFWPLDWVISFKRWLRRPIGLDIFMAPKKPLEGASIVAFHGNPRPISLVRSTWGFWDSFPHMGYGRVPWMRDYWTLNGGEIPK